MSQHTRTWKLLQQFCHVIEYPQYKYYAIKFTTTFRILKFNENVLHYRELIIVKYVNHLTYILSNHL